MGNTNSNLIDVNTDINYNIQDSIASKDNLKKILIAQQLTLDKLYSQKPASARALASPDIKMYLDAYNESTALLDDPTNINRANFDTFIHLQNKKINELQNAINTFPTYAQVKKPIKSIKNMLTSKLLNVEEYRELNITDTSLSNINDAPTYPNYLIYGNNGCLQYTKENNTPGIWAFASCNSNNAKQRFTINPIPNIQAYNDIIDNSLVNPSYKINDPKSSTFPFYVVNPELSPEHCLMLNNDGLSVMPCNMTAEQRFKPVYRSIMP